MTKVTHDSETLAKGQQVITATAFIHYDFAGVIKLFLPKRATTKKFLPGLYELPGGHIDFGEDLVEGLRREIKEELNMTIRIGDPFAAFTYMNRVKGSHSIEVVYFAQFVEPIEQVTLQPEDHARYDWFSRDEIVQRSVEPTAVSRAVQRDVNDPEYQAMLKGFDVLAGQTLNIAS